jgi:hypothetical protein
LRIEGFQAQERFIPRRGPELARPFKAALVMATGRFNGAGAQGFVGEVTLLGGGVAVFYGGAGVEDVLVLSWPTPSRQCHMVANAWLKRRRLQLGCPANNW